MWLLYGFSTSVGARTLFPVYCAQSAVKLTFGVSHIDPQRTGLRLSSHNKCVQENEFGPSDSVQHPCEHLYYRGVVSELFRNATSKIE